MAEPRPTLLYAPLFPATLSFATGIILYSLTSLWWILGLAIAASVICLVLRRNYLLLMWLALAIGAINAYVRTPSELPDGFYGREAVMCGVVEKTKETEEALTMTVEVDSVNGAACRGFRIHVTDWNFSPYIPEASRITFKAKPERVESKADLPDEFDYADYLIRNGVVATASITGDDVTAVVDADGVIPAVRRLRGQIKDVILRSELSDYSKELLVTTLTGDTSILPPETREMFSKAGLAHILALSGLHVAIITLVISLMLSPLMLFGLTMIRRIIVVMLLWVFAVMTGLSPSVVRAVVMATVLMLALTLQRRPAPVNSLSFAALVILLFDPMAVYSIGFQLSFLSVLSILLLVDRLNPVSPRRRVAYYFTSAIAVSVSAMIATGIVAAYYFHIFPVYFLLANIPATLLLPLIIGGGVVIVMLEAAGLPCGVIVWSVDMLTECVRLINESVASLPGATTTGVFLSPLQVALWLTVIALIVMWLYKKKTVFVATACGVAAIIIATVAFQPHYAEQPIAYIPRHSGSTSVLVCGAGKLQVYTTALAPDHPSLREKITSRYGNFLSRRSIDSVEIHKASGKLLKINGKSILLVDSDRISAVADSVDYLLICRGFKGDPVSLASSIPSRNIVLSADIHPRRHDRYLSELSSAGITPINHRKKALIFFK